MHRFAGLTVAVLAGCFAGGRGGPDDESVPSCASKAAAIRGATLGATCTQFPDATVETFENDFLKPTCGKSSTCHKKASIFDPDIDGTDSFLSMAGVTGKTTTCLSDTLINLDDPAKSVVLVISRNETLDCPSDNTTQLPERMPKTTELMPLEPLTVDEYACLEAYVNAVVNACNN